MEMNYLIIGNTFGQVKALIMTHPQMTLMEMEWVTTSME